MPIKGLTGDLFIVDTETGEWNKLSTLEEAKLGEPSKEEMQAIVIEAKYHFDVVLESGVEDGKND